MGTELNSTYIQSMQITDHVRSISYLKANAADLLKELAESGRPVVITQNGEAKAVLQDVGAFEQMQESLAMLKLMALSRKSAQDQGTVSLDAAEAEIRARTAE